MERDRDAERITMFAKLKKKIAEEAATAPRSNVRIPRTISKESITSVGADSGDDFVSGWLKCLLPYKNWLLTGRNIQNGFRNQLHISQIYVIKY